MADSNSNSQDMIAQIHSLLSSAQKPDYGVLGSLAGAYGAYTNGNNVSNAYGASATDAADQAATLKTQMDNMPTLATMYGQDSPYAKQMQLQLAAKDAAAGRNSQYGPRIQALQADLASKGSQYAQQQASMAQAYTNARNNANNQRAQATVNQNQVQGQQLGALFNLGQKSGVLPAMNQSIGDGIKTGATGLSNMFGGSDQGTPQQPLNQSVYGGNGNYTGYTTGSDQNSMGAPSYQSNGGMGQMYNDPNTYVNPDNQQTYNTPTNTDLLDEN